ncbi:MAG: DUF3857 domain-containing protein, partial [Alphaproteobacteria bacterium]
MRYFSRKTASPFPAQRTSGNPFLYKALLAVFVTFLVAPPAFAEEQDAADIFSKYDHYYIDIAVDETGAATKTYDTGLTVLKEDAVKDAKETSFEYSTSVEKADIIAAYTKKPDGKHIDVPPNNFQLDVNSGKDKQAPAFSDYTTMTVIFPDVAVGDTLVLSYKITESEPMFPKQFSLAEPFSRYFTYDDARVTLSIPASLHPTYENFGLTEKQNKEVNGRKIYEWTFQNKKPTKIPLQTSRVYDFAQEPSVLISTFPSYAAIAEAYG